MTKNRLQAELERVRASGSVTNLINTNFHDAGFKLPASLLRRAYDTFLRSRHYTPDPQGSPEARAAIAAYYRRAGLAVAPEELVITASTSEAYQLIFSRLTEPGDNVLLPAPGYPLFDYIAEFNHLTCRYYRTRFDDAFALRMEQLEAQLDDRTRAIVLISPHNPTGRVADEAELAVLCGLAAERAIPLLCDEVFSELLYESSRLPRAAAVAADAGTAGAPASGGAEAPASRALVLTLNGISKMFAAPDLKLGWIAVSGPQPHKSALIEELTFANDMFLNCSAPSQHMLPMLFTEAAGFQRRMLHEIGTRRERLLQLLASIDGVTVVPPAGGVHCVVRVSHSDYPDDEELSLSLLRRFHVYTHPGYLYGIENDVCLVLSFLPPAEELEHGLNALGELLQ